MHIGSISFFSQYHFRTLLLLSKQFTLYLDPTVQCHYNMKDKID